MTARLVRWLFHCILSCRAYRFDCTLCTRCAALKPPKLPVLP